MTDDEIETVLTELASIYDFDREHAARVIAKRPDAIIMRTATDKDGVSYEVIAAGGGVGMSHAFEQGENEQGIWSRDVTFGHNIAASRRGFLFQTAAHEQQVIVDLLTDIVIARSGS